MEIWQFLVALIQGTLEWLPISSQGQTVLFVYNLGAVPVESLVALAAWLHLGTMFAVLLRYPRDILNILSLKDRTLFRLLFIATVGTAIVGVPFYLVRKISMAAFLGERLNLVVGLLLLTTAVILYISKARVQEGEGDQPGRLPTEREALLTGLVQGLSILPGLSRSGITVSSLLMQKVGKEAAFKFSFLMSVPAVLGILALELVTGDLSSLTIGTTDLLVMEVIVFLVGLASMEILLRLSRRVSFWKLCVILAFVAIAFGLPSYL